MFCQSVLVYYAWCCWLIISQTQRIPCKECNTSDTCTSLPLANATLKACIRPWRQSAHRVSLACVSWCPAASSDWFLQRLAPRHVVRGGWYWSAHDWHNRLFSVPASRMVLARPRSDMLFGLQLSKCLNTQTYLFPLTLFRWPNT